MKRFAVIVAGGSGSRMRSELPKQFIEIKGKPILIYTLEAYLLAEPSVELILVLPSVHLEKGKKFCQQFLPKTNILFSEGGKTRFHSVQNGLCKVTEGSLVAIHDAVRPMVSVSVIQNSFDTAQETGSAIATVALKDSLRLQSGSGSKAVDRSAYRIVQTPQTFQTDLIRKAVEQVTDPAKFTDDAGVFEQAGHAVTLIEGNYENIKITTPEDLLVASALLQRR